MYDWKPSEKSQGEQADLEKRLSAYYGPEFRERPLPESSWVRLRSKLGPQSSSRRWRMPRLRIHRYLYRRSTPAYVQTAFARIIHEARLPWSSSLLHCTFKANAHVPSVRVTLFARHNIRLSLPSNLAQTVEPAALDVLLATGLARYFYLRKPASLFLHLLAAIVLVACAALVLFWKSSMSYLEIPIAVVACAVLLGFAYIKGRKMSFRADDLMVRWLGRSTACQGLHALAASSHKRFRVRWDEPSLAERISRICGTQVEVKNERLTLVR